MKKSKLLGRTTEQILADKKITPLHLMGNPGSHAVSLESSWASPVWRLDAKEGGTINWDVSLGVDGSLIDANHASMLDAFRRFQWSRYADPRIGKAAKLGGAATSSVAIRRLARWMARRGHRDFSTLDSDAFNEFIDDLSAELLVDSQPQMSEVRLADFDGQENEFDDIDEDLEKVLTDEEEIPSDIADNGIFSALYRSISLWRSIWGQSAALADGRIATMPADPLNGKSALSLARDLTTWVAKTIPPLPDEVALPIMTEAHRWLGVRADDVIRLHNHYVTLYALFDAEDAGISPKISKDQALRLGRFEFSVEPGCAEPWHAPIEAERNVNGIVRQRSYYTSQTIQVRDLVDAVRNACSIVIQSESGMRIGEICSIPAGTSATTGQHASVAIRFSKSGLNELFFVRSLLHKTVDAAKSEEWLIGSRPVGSVYEPGPLRAIKIAEALLAPWRRMSDDPEVKKHLFVHKDKGSTLPRKGDNVVVATGPNLRTGQKDFVGTYVDLKNLPNRSTLDENLEPYIKSGGRCIRTHQWRKTFAMYVVRTDRRMIPAIATQFKHLSVAMTEQAYIGNDSQLMREHGSQQARAAAAFMYSIIVGEAPAAGRMARLIDEHAEEIRAVVGDRRGAEGVGRLQDWCAARGIRVFSAPHGGCFIGIKPTAARCHELAGTTSWKVKSPNYAKREPDVCAGCSCFGVDANHGEFWLERYTENQTAWLQAKRAGLTAGFRVIQDRAAQSATMFRVLGLDIPEIKEVDCAKKAT